MQIEITPSFSRALDIIGSGETNVFLTGRAGTGKSTLLRHLCDTQATPTAVVASTGVAAINARGQTIHRFFRFPTTVTPEAIRSGEIKARNAKLYKNLRQLIIDEVSMVRADLLDCVDVFLRMHGPKPGTPFGGVQMLYFGDLYQLPPVVRREEWEIFSTFYDSPFFFSAKALQDVPINIIELDKVFRQKDREFVEILNSIRNGSIDEAGLNFLNRQFKPGFSVPKDEFYITLTSMNKSADKINLDLLEALPHTKRSLMAEVHGDFTKEYYPAPMMLEYKVGAQIMMLNNDSAGRWVNGSIGVIKEAETGQAESRVVVQLQDGNEIVEVKPHEWGLSRLEFSDGALVPVQIGTFCQLPFRLAWAVTIHKSQGKTFDRMVIDLGRIFSPGQTYVALSRCTSLDRIVLRRPVSIRDIRVDYRVQRFFSYEQYKLADRALTASRKSDLI